MEDEVERATKEALKVNFASIPDELKSNKQWVVWKYELVEEALKKPPFSPVTGKRASVRKPQTWGSFADIRAAYETGQYAGIGYMLTGGLVAFDLDHCIEDGQLNKLAIWMTTYLGTYAEGSPSGTGVRILMHGHLPGPFKRRSQVEMYEEARYVTLTGHWIANTPTQVMSDQMKLNYAYRKIFESSLRQERTHEQSRVYRPQNLTHELVIQKALAAKNGKLFERYWNGDNSLWEGPGAIHRSPSDADWQLVLFLLYWTNGDTNQVDALFRMSGLMRDKWDRVTKDNETYGQITRKKCLETYLANRSS